MATAFTFIKRNSKLTSNLLPTGFVNTGIMGSDGKPGEIGSSLYFIDYDPFNSYYKELVIKRIEKNFILSSNNSQKLEGRTYRVGDIIMSKDLNMYRLIDAGPNSKYKFDIEYIGKMISDVDKDDSTISNAFVDIELINYQRLREKCVVPVNRSFDRDSINKTTIKFDSISKAPKQPGSTVDPYVTYTLSCGSTSLSATVTFDFIDLSFMPFSQKFIEKITTSMNNLISGTSFHDFVITSSYTDKTITITTGRRIAHFNMTNMHLLSADVTESGATNGLSFKDAEGNGFTEIFRNKSAEYYYHTSSFENAYRGLYGLSFIPSVRFGSDTILDGYDFYLRIYIKNTKSIQEGCCNLQYGSSDAFDMLPSNTSPLDPVQSHMNGNISFYKCVEMKLDKLNPEGRYDSSTDISEYQYFISDMAADKLHPSGNNINISYLYPGIEKVHGSRLIDAHGVAPMSTSPYYYWGAISYILTSNDNFATNLNAAIDSSIKPVLPATVGDESKTSKGAYNYKIEIHSDQSVDGEADYTSFRNSFINDPYKLNHNIVQYSKRSADDVPAYPTTPKYPVNFRGGESAYFSGMTIPELGSRYTGAQLFMNDADQNMKGTLATSDGTYDNYVSNIMSSNKNTCIADSRYFTGNSSLRYQLDTVVYQREMAIMNYVTDKIEKFIFSEDNRYELVCVARTGDDRGVVSVLPIDYKYIIKSKP